MAKREEFTDKIKRKAAEKVGYFCSNPNCKRFTIGPNDKGNPQRYGEAAHIYPASYGGPRADSSITTDYLKSEANCLWLCNTCHKIIDANPSNYSPELLNEWKQTAEDRAFKLVTNPEKAKKLISDIEKTSGLSNFFDQLFLRGDFSKVAISIKELFDNDDLAENDKEEVAFAQIRFDSFCARKNVATSFELSSSFSQPTKERLVDFAIETFDKDLCGKVLLMSENAAKRELASKISSNEDYESILNWLKENAKYLNNQYLVNSIYIVGGSFSGKVILDMSGQRISFRKGWLIETCDTILDFLFDIMNRKHIDEKRMQSIVDVQEVYLWLDAYYVSRLFDNNYHFFPKGQLLESLFRFFIERGISTPDIRLHYFLDIIQIQNQDNFDYVLSIGKKYNDIQLISYVLSIVSQKQPEKVLEFVDENPELLTQHLMIADSYRLVKSRLNQSFDLLSFLDNEYVGIKNDEYCVLRAAALKEAKNDTEFQKCWEQYKRLVNYDDVFVTLALQIARDINDEEFVRDVCSKSMEATNLFYAAKTIHDKFSSLDLISLIIGRLEGCIGTLPANYNRLMFALLCKAQRYKEALNYGEKAYLDDGAKEIAVYLIQIRLNLALYDEDELVRDILLTTRDCKALSLLGHLFIRSGEQRKGWDCVARATALQNNYSDLSILGSFMQCTLISPKDESNEYSYVVLNSGRSFLLLPPSEKEYFGDKIFDVDVFYTDTQRELCFLKKDENVSFDKKEDLVKEIYDYYYFFHARAMESLIKSPYAKAFQSDDPQALITQLLDFVADSQKQQDNFLASTNGQTLPFFMFSKAFGRDTFSAVAALYYSDKRKSFFVFTDKTSENLPTIDRPLFDVESFYLAHRLGISTDTILKNQCCITSLTKGLLSNEIKEKENEYKDSSERGILTINKENNKPLFIERTREDRQRAMDELQKIKQLLDCFEAVSPKLESYTSEQTEILNKLKSIGDDIDAEVLEALWSGKTLISNNKTFFIGQNLGSGIAVDLSGFLAVSIISLEELIKVIKCLRKTNIVQYLTPDIFNSIMIKLNQMAEGEMKERVIQDIVDLIKGNWDGDWTEDELERHQSIVYLAAIDERINFDKIDPIHVALKELFNQMVTKYFYSLYSK